MGDGTQHTILPMVSRARWLPKLDYPRWKKWYTTTTYHSEAANGLVPYTFPSGVNREILAFARRQYADATTPPARTVGTIVDLTTPAYMLASNTAANDSLVGS